MELYVCENIEDVIYDELPKDFYKFRDWRLDIELESLNIMLGSKILEQAYIKNLPLKGTVSLDEVYYILVKNVYEGRVGLYPKRVTYKASTLRDRARYQKKFGNRVEKY